MAKGKKQGSDMKKRMASVRRCLTRLVEKYLPEVDILAVGEMSESERKAFFLEIIDLKIAKPRFDPTQNDVQKILHLKALYEKTKDIDPTPEQKAETGKQILQILQGTNFDPTHTFEYLQREVWIPSLHRTITPRTDCPLHDQPAVMLMPLNERHAVEWMRDLCRYGADVYHYVQSTCRMLFPELEGDLNILNPTFINFVLNTPYRNIAADMLGNAVCTMRYQLKPHPSEIDDYIRDMRMEVTRYGAQGMSDVEIFIMRIMAMLSNAITNLHLRDYWKEEEESR